MASLKGLMNSRSLGVHLNFFGEEGQKVLRLKGLFLMAFYERKGWNRTADLLITNQLLYRLSYFGFEGANPNDASEQAQDSP